ncbi:MULTISPECIES: substrate-binding domain-containing protein [unclassified Streptomyces]|uniref:substrate-binding domain-containing protein n=1 Tax=unclassified Streptomyces TaxID=2593676 RepID=UPI0016567B4F|nr:substrate-binding domain-containing protein [Streptomyces sp. CB02980]MCB8904268.1 substrate-binding domain-containing protein [Streptomyces sp. CB02980]
MNVKSRARIGAALGVAALGLGVALAPAAQADPNPITQYRTLAGTGSDTTQDVLNGLGNVVVNALGQKIIASWDATGSATIKTKATGCVINRPNGSSAGIDALRNAVDTNSGCLDFARSSRGPADTSTTDLTWIPFAKDAVSWAKRSDSALPSDLTATQLKDIYECNLTSLNGVALTPILPQSNSGTRQFFLSSIGVTTPGACVQQGVQENDGTVLDSAGDVAPYSVASYTAQEKGVVTNRRGAAVLGSVGTVAPRNADKTLNPAFPYLRDVYNVVPTAKLTNATISATFVGSTSKVCAATTTITNYGFGSLGTACGATTVKGER